MENSNIEWTDHTFNPFIGCSKVSPGCKNCYAETLMDTRYGKVKWGPHGTRVRTSPENWKKPVRWDRDALRAHNEWERRVLFDSTIPEPHRPRVFCASLADVFEDRPELVEWRKDLFKLIDATPYLEWLLLTKRPENIVMMWPEEKDDDYGGMALSPGAYGAERKVRTNVRLMTSVENRETADERIPALLCASHLCGGKTGLSMEPLLEPVRLRHIYMIGGGAAVSVNPLTGNRNNGNVMRLLMGGPRRYNNIQWVIVGGESGANRRPFDTDWARDIMRDCKEAGVPFFFKQVDKVIPVPHDLMVREFPANC